MGKVCFIPTSYPRAQNSIATSSTIKPSKLIAPTTAGHQTLPSPSWRSRLPQGFLMTVKAPRGRSALQASLLARADRIHESESQGRPVFVYFHNDGEGNAVWNASGLKTFV